MAMRSKWRAAAKLLVLLLVCTCGAAAQSRDVGDLAVGRLLVAPRGAVDPIFAKSVVLLVRYDKTGALGLMLNHRTKLPVARALNGLKQADGISQPIFVGGPVQLSAVFALARASRKPEDATQVAGDVYFFETKTGVENAIGEAVRPDRVRIYLGYCGWRAGQLNNEVLEGRWYIFNGREDLAFDAAPANLWQMLIGETEQRTAMLGYDALFSFGLWPRQPAF